MKIYNTLNRKKEDLKTITPQCIKMYTCGQTVYNDIHLGNARFYVVFDAVRRYLEHRGYSVEYIQNFTDIDDKIIQRAIEENCTTQDISQKYIARTLEDLDALNVCRATKHPLATEEMPEIIAMIAELIAKGHAYEKSGSVYYNVTTFDGYGKLSKKNIEDLEAGARVEVETGKTNPMDFVLWKPAKPNEPFWQSPWGNGRPGWHIECSAMVRKYLGDEIDIHGGGVDLTFPHHENEIAQTEALTGKDFARYWMHSGILTTDHKKMSKSSGNFATLREVAEKVPYDVIRFYFLSGHYRMPMEFTETVLAAAKQGLNRIKTCYANMQHTLANHPDRGRDLSPWVVTLWDDVVSRLEYTGEIDLLKSLENHIENFHRAMDDDFNTADAITAIFQLVTDINVHMNDKTLSEYTLQKSIETLTLLTDILGIKISIEEENLDAEIESLIAARQEARKNKNFAESDRIRDELINRGIVLEDTREGVRWYRA